MVKRTDHKKPSKAPRARTTAYPAGRARKLAKRDPPKAAPPPEPAKGKRPKPPPARMFKQAVDVPDPTPAQAKARAAAGVYVDPGSVTALVLRLDPVSVTMIPMARSGESFQVVTVPLAKFNELRYHLIPDYPVGRAAKLYLGYLINNGGTGEALAELGNLVTVTKQESDMAKAKMAVIDGGKATKGKAPKAAKGPKAPRASGPTAATRFKELIMAGKLADDDIFAAVQKEFKLDDKKRSYVAWYRNWLRKAGSKPPEPKAAKKTA